GAAGGELALRKAPAPGRLRLRAVADRPSLDGSAWRVQRGERVGPVRGTAVDEEHRQRESQGADPPRGRPPPRTVDHPTQGEARAFRQVPAPSDDGVVTGASSTSSGKWHAT